MACLHQYVSSRAPEGASVHGGAVVLFKSVERPREEAHPCPHLRARTQPQAAAGPVGSEGRPSARRGPGLEIQGPQCAFETSMFMCPAVHMSTRNLLRSSSTHEPSDPPFRVVSWLVLLLPCGSNIVIGQVRSRFFSTWQAGVRTTGAVTAGTLPVTRRESRVIVLGAVIGFKDFRQIVRAQGPVTPRGAVLVVTNRHGTPAGRHSCRWREAVAPGCPPLFLGRASPSLSLFCFGSAVNDPSAGSPTETLLRLLLPLNDQVRASSQWNRRGEPPRPPVRRPH